MPGMQIPVNLFCLCSSSPETKYTILLVELLYTLQQAGDTRHGQILITFSSWTIDLVQKGPLLTLLPC